MNIAILVPVCSRKQNYLSIEEISFLKYLYPSFQNTKEDGYNYKFFIGYDDDDEFYIKHSESLKSITENIFCLEGCQHAPATAWNKLAKLAYNDPVKYDYFFQIGDDVLLQTQNWTSAFINKLKQNNDIGVVGPCNLNNYNGRVSQGKPYVIENAFVSKKHLEIFGYFFHPFIKNWYCDDWITEIYKNSFSEIQLDYLCRNSVMDRYTINNCNGIQGLINEGSHMITKYVNSNKCFSYCIFGDKKKYCLGMIKNLEQIKSLFPGYKVVIYLGNDVPQEYIDQYQKYDNVKLIQLDFTGLLVTIYRYLVIKEDYDVVFVRDADSRFGDRDIWCINHFLNSDYKIFTIRDHSWHGREMMAGQTGLKKLEINILEKLDDYLKKNENLNKYQNDQDFIKTFIFDSYKHVLISYAEFYYFGEKTTIKIPLPRKSVEDFCGNVYSFDKDDNEYTEFTIYGRK